MKRGMLKTFKSFVFSNWNNFFLNFWRIFKFLNEMTVCPLSSQNSQESTSTAEMLIYRHGFLIQIKWEGHQQDLQVELRPNLPSPSVIIHYSNHINLRSWNFRYTWPYISNQSCMMGRFCKTRWKWTKYTQRALFGFIRGDLAP